MKAEVNFLGGVAGSLTGSCSLLTVTEGKKTFKVLIDAGLVQCGFRDSIKTNQEILKQLKPSQVDYIILTHPHIDHIGRLPLFIKNGFEGEIICTKGTRNLLKPMLEDSAKIQMVEAAYYNKKLLKMEERGEVKLSFQKTNRRIKGKNKKREKGENYFENLYSSENINSSLGSKKKTYVEPLYSHKDVEALHRFVNNGYDYHRWIKLSKFISVKFYHSGHVMGGAVVVVRLSSKSKGVKPNDVYLCFSGDLGRRDGIILPPPEIINEPVDFLFLESTYGGRTHPNRDQEIEKLLDLIKESSESKKRVIIPSFALERSQEIVYILSYYMDQGVIPSIPIYLDSPLGSKITETFAEAWDQKMFSDQDRVTFNPFDPKSNPYFNIISEQKESDALIASSKGYIVIAGSGMCDAGRVRGHLRANLGKSDTIVCLVGYMALNSLGRNLKEGLPIKMNGEAIEVKAKVISFDSFSAHADEPFLIDYAVKVLSKDKTRTKTVFLVHGDESAAAILGHSLMSFVPEGSLVKIPALNSKEIIH